MRKTKSVAYGDEKETVVRELTANEIDRLFDQEGSRPMTTLDNLLDVHDLTTSILAAMCGMDEQQMAEMIGGLTPSGYAPIITAAKELNPDFFAVARNLKNRAEMMANIGKMLGMSSDPRSASSSSTDTSTPGTMA